MIAFACQLQQQLRQQLLQQNAQQQQQQLHVAAAAEANKPKLERGC